MPVFDFRCNLCNHTELDVFQHTYAPFLCVQRIPFEHEDDAYPSSGSHPCGGSMEKVLLPGKGTNVIGDECDIRIEHGLCHSDGTPRRFRSKAEIHRAAKEKGLVNYVQHVTPPHTDKSKFTTRWT